MEQPDLLHLVLASSERIDLDFKDDILLGGEKKAKAELTKDIIAMANSGGGFVVGGVAETKTGWERRGLTDAALRSFDSTPLNDFVKNYCEPPINATTARVEVDGRVFGIVIVPEFGEQPHVVKADFPGVFHEGDILVRTDANQSARAKGHDLRRLLDRAVLRRRESFTAFLGAVAKVHGPAHGQALPRAEPIVPFDKESYFARHLGFRIVSLTALGDPPKVRPLQLAGAVEKSSIWHRTGYVEFPLPRAQDGHELRLPNGIAREQESELGSLYFSSYDTSGNVVVIESMNEDRRAPQIPPNTLSFEFTSVFLTDAMEFASRYYGALGWKGQVLANFSVESRIPRVLRRLDGRLPFSGRVTHPMAESISVEATTPLGDPAAVNEATASMLRDFCWRLFMDMDDTRAAAIVGEIKTAYLPR